MKIKKLQEIRKLATSYFEKKYVPTANATRLKQFSPFLGEWEEVIEYRHDEWDAASIDADIFNRVNEVVHKIAEKEISKRQKKIRYYWGKQISINWLKKINWSND